MADMFCTVIFLGFFGLVIYDTLRKKASTGAGSGINLGEARESVATPPVPSGPVGLYCEICGGHARVVSSEEYRRLAPPVYCSSCRFVIERYRARV